MLVQILSALGGSRNHYPPDDGFNEQVLIAVQPTSNVWRSTRSLWFATFNSWRLIGLNMTENSYKALKIYAWADDHSVKIENLPLDDLYSYEVVIKGHYSSINYKDALAVSGTSKILRRSPLIAGIDISGIVEVSNCSEFKQGDRVVVCGCGLSETRDGGFAEYTGVPANCVQRLPENISLFEAMAIGSAGFTAALAIQRMEHNDQKPELGPVVVTGASGGVGSYAVDLLSNRGYDTVAISGKRQRRDYLLSLGAGDVVSRQSLVLGELPLERGEWGGAIDNVGGDLLSWLTRSVKPMGNIACVGLAGGVQINTTVMPFILRGINLLGIDSVHCSQQTRSTIWNRLGTDLRPRHIDEIVNREIGLDEIPTVVDDYVRGKNSGRTVVNLQR